MSYIDSPVPPFHLKQIFEIPDAKDFESFAIEIFKFQAQYCKVYADFLSRLNIDIPNILSYRSIPFLPVSFFKNKSIITSGYKPVIQFSSSATSGQGESSHMVADVSLYIESFVKGFEMQFGKLESCIILGLLPSYLEREGSSLVYMVDDLIKKTKHQLSGFYLHNFDALKDALQTAAQTDRQVILIGVTYALLDFSEFCGPLPDDIIVLETGGMKGRRAELTKHELHELLKSNFHIDDIGGEYGMTELLSQAYSIRNGIYRTPPWMKIVVTEINDPFQVLSNNEWGRINMIDLANIFSCSFIATDDIGRDLGNNQFELAGRIDFSDMRGCSLLHS